MRRLVANSMSVLLVARAGWPVERKDRGGNARAVRRIAFLTDNPFEDKGKRRCLPRGATVYR